MTTQPTSDWALLDIGGSTGALVLTVDPAWIGQEVEVAPVGSAGPPTHTVVRAGSAGSRALFAALPCGDYVVTRPSIPGAVITVDAGTVTFAEAPTRRVM